MKNLLFLLCFTLGACAQQIYPKTESIKIYSQYRLIDSNPECSIHIIEIWAYRISLDGGSFDRSIEDYGDSHYVNYVESDSIKV